MPPILDVAQERLRNFLGITEKRVDVRCHDEVDGVEDPDQCRFVQNSFRVPRHLEEVPGVMAEGTSHDLTRLARSVQGNARPWARVPIVPSCHVHLHTTRKCMPIALYLPETMDHSVRPVSDNRLPSCDGRCR